jgi:hypothetical protein
LQPVSIQEQEKLVSGLLWDSPLTPHQFLRILRGESSEQSSFDRPWAAARLLASLPWYSILKILPLSEVKALISRDVLDRIYPQSVRKQYEILGRILRGETISVAGWDPAAHERIPSAVLPDGRHSA